MPALDRSGNGLPEISRQAQDVRERGRPNCRGGGEREALAPHRWAAALVPVRRIRLEHHADISQLYRIYMRMLVIDRSLLFLTCSVGSTVWCIVPEV